jgi:putative ABC transport system permease protein
VINVLDRRTVYATIGSSPLQSGMRGLLTAGAALAVGLAVLGSVVQSVLNARRRSVQFAVLRTIGMGTRQLRRLLLGEQAVVYAFGLVGGLALGVILAGATLPYLQFNDATLDASTSGVPPDRLVIEPQSLGIFCAVLALALLLGLFLTARAAARIGLGSTLRLGED